MNQQIFSYLSNEKLDYNNISSWKYKMQNLILFGQGYWSYIEGDLEIILEIINFVYLIWQLNA